MLRITMRFFVFMRHSSHQIKFYILHKTLKISSYS